MVLIFTGTFLYLLFVWWVFFKLHHKSLNASKSPDQVMGFSIVIPFRNEEKNLPRLFESIENLQTEVPFEVIWVDDHSDDHSNKVLSSLTSETNNHHVFASPERGKKDAQTFGVSQANFDWLVFTDADVLLPSTFLGHICKTISQDAGINLVCGPVVLHARGYWQKMQGMDTLALMASTKVLIESGHPVMANGAHLAVKKTVFEELQPTLSQIGHRGGDDTFLLQLMAKEYGPKSIAWSINDIPVITSACAGFICWYHQRIRWASKTSLYPSPFSKVLASVVWLANAAIIPGWIIYPEITGYVVFAKILSEWFLLEKAAKVFKYPLCSRPFIVQAFFNFIYVPIIGLLALFYSGKWKGRPTNFSAV